MYEEHVFDKKQVIFGLERILWGYFKKLVVADTILTATTAVIGDEYYNGAWVLVGIIFYGIELYADFTGGIDITIGIAQVFGVKVAENFIRPYFSKILRNIGGAGIFPWEPGSGTIFLSNEHFQTNGKADKVL